MSVPLNQLRRPVVVAAFEGWNDAADAATEVINHLATNYPTEEAWQLDSEDYYDFQVTRPRIELSENGREFQWPGTVVSVAHLPERDLVLVAGPEPNLRWRSFCAALVSLFRSVQPEYVVLLGAMLTDCPHSRPLPVTATSTDGQLALALGLKDPNYEGPTGIVGALAEACGAGGFRTVSLWASVPHYVATSPNPKATLSLLRKLEEVLDTALDAAELPVLTKRWEEGVDELASEDPDIAEYIATLEEDQDEEVVAGAGDTIAAEFQRYLRRHPDDCG